MTAKTISTQTGRTGSDWMNHNPITASLRVRLVILSVAAVSVLSPAAYAQPSPSPPAADISRTTQEVFQRPEFQTPERSETGIAAWLLRQIVSFFQWLGSLYDGSPPIFWLMLIGCFVLLVALIILIVFQVRAAFAVGGKRRREDVARTGRILVSDRYRVMADEHAAAADYTEAVRYLFLAIVYRFDERGRISFHQEYTNREYLDLMSPNVRDALRLLVDVLDEHWYGQRPCRRQQYEECLTVYQRLVMGRDR